MSVTVTVAEDGTLGLAFSGQSTAQALTLAREYVPDIDERIAAFAAGFQRAWVSDAGVPDADAGDGDPGAGTQGPREPEGQDAAEDPGQSESSGDVDPGGRMEEEEVNCKLCGTSVTKDWAEITMAENGAVLCPGHTA